ncbi:GNAT family N-acetyltransferase [Lutibaculum baratangense]|uniref:GNAT family N-acetyltransferase n=1 Tax=Lutibaculum baratangense TaxID=1358440 RepID=UPI00058B8FED|nr:GNAT family N-acetyltransferase [Lutibaculum baratangense]
MSDHDFVVRPAARADLPAITAIYAQAVLHGTGSFEITPPDEAEMGRRVSSLLDGGFPYFVGERGGRVVGYAYAGPHHTRRAYRWSLDTSVYILPEAQGAGLGNALLAALIETAETQGFRQMIAVIGDAANAGSIALHRRHGFRHVGTYESVGRKHARWLSTVLMQRALGPGDDAPPPEED